MEPGIILQEPDQVGAPQGPTPPSKKGLFSRVRVPSVGPSEDLYQKGLSTVRDLIAPPAIKVMPGSMRIGSVVARTLFVVAYPRFLSTSWFSPIVNIDFPMDISLFIHPVDTAEILKNLRKQSAQIQSQIGLEAEGGKVRNPVLETALEDVEGLRDRLQQGTEHFFRFGLYLTLYGADDKDLDDKTNQIEANLGSPAGLYQAGYPAHGPGLYGDAAACRRYFGRGQQSQYRAARYHFPLCFV
ncbi:MAG: hypothetical protein WDN67_02670 [Candidatus Moraniibacteriota bacterium]